MAEAIEVIKLNLRREETWRYTGEVLRRTQNSVVLRALFNRDDMPFHEIVLKRGDLFVEGFYSDHWYNIFEIRDRDDGHMKGWYCNICRPAEFSAGQVTYVDLALDLLVYADGRQLVLDEDEFTALALSDGECGAALSALAELQSLASAGRLSPYLD